MDKVKVLIKYGELTLKKRNLDEFKTMLLNNIQGALANFNVEVVKTHSRIYVDFDKANYEEVMKILKGIYGIHSFAVYKSCENDVDVIKELALEMINECKKGSFKVETKRSNKKFEIKSLEVSRMVGGYINQNSDYDVEVHNPDIMLRIEIRNDKTFIYTNLIQGAGGLPVGVGGKGLLMLSGGIDSPVAGYLINKRGVKFDAIHFTSPPYTQKQSLQKVYDLCDKLKIYNGEFKLYVVKFTAVQEELLTMKRESYFMPIMRRMMYRVANEICASKNYKLIINGDSIGQVASQTIESMNVVDDVCKVSVMRPLGIFDKVEVINIAKKIDTYDISIRQFEDCCTIFVPKSPIIRPKAEVIDKVEKHFDIDKMLSDTMNNIEVIDIKVINDKFDEYL